MIKKKVFDYLLKILLGNILNKYRVLLLNLKIFLFDFFHHTKLYQVTIIIVLNDNNLLYKLSSFIIITANQLFLINHHETARYIELVIEI